MQTSLDRIVIDPNICNGIPIIKGTRISVTTILEYLKAGDTADDILSQYPGLEYDDISACYELAIRMASSSFHVQPIAVG